MIIMCPKVYSNSIHIKDFYSTIVGNIQKITKKKLVGTCGAKTSSLLSGWNTLKSDFSLPLDFATVGIAKSINITFSVGKGLCYLQGSLIFLFLIKWTTYYAY
jgi:hypothetical protein